jgi:hypothetical protein
MHRSDLYGWSSFDEQRNIDFHSILWARAGGNVAIDPLPQTEHDREHLLSIGGVRTIVITNSDHVRDAGPLREVTGAKLLGPAAERESFPIECDGWINDGDEVVPGLVAYALHGSKTPGELALLLEDKTLITGDLIRCHEGGRLTTLPVAKLSDERKAMASVERLASVRGIENVLPGDGWPIFRCGADALAELVSNVRGALESRPL